MEEKKNPQIPVWERWGLALLAASQILTIAQTRQANQELWKAVVQQDKAITRLSQELVQQKQELVQLGQHLIEHRQNDILYKAELERLLEKIQNSACSKCDVNQIAEELVEGLKRRYCSLL